MELASTPPNIALNLFIEWVGGLAGNADVQKEESSIVRIVIAGNSIKGCADKHLSKGHTSGKAEDAAAAKEMVNGVKRLDSLLATLGSNCCVTVIPGQFDLTSFMMPQKPMHPASFATAKKFVY